jgi:hypothetical protein
MFVPSVHPSRCISSKNGLRDAFVVVGVARKQHDREHSARVLRECRGRHKDAGGKQPKDRSPGRHARIAPNQAEILRVNRPAAALFRAGLRQDYHPGKP